MQKKLPRGARQGDFHSIGFISIPHPDNRMKGYFIGLDLTHHVTATNPKARVLVVHGTDKTTVMEKLNDIYRGGRWELYRFDPNFVGKGADNTKHGTYVFDE
ncbi:MAG: hypothetical protein ACD_72C00469G0002 [uncultured bacterium]|nr:MAG: hypothetical protein ACD_72C00469G0002 [uncultured bacterium]